MCFSAQCQLGGHQSASAMGPRRSYYTFPRAAPVQSAPHLILCWSVSTLFQIGRLPVPSITCIAIRRKDNVSREYLSSKKGCTYFPPFTGSMPKLDPTTPVQVQFSSAAFVHLAVAVAPTFRHVIDADAGDKTRTARVTVRRANIIIVELGSAYDNWKKAKNSRHNHLLYIYSVHSATAMAPIRRSDFGICCSLG